MAPKKKVVKATKGVRLLRCTQPQSILGRANALS